MLKTYELVSPYVANPVHAFFTYETDKKEFGLFIPKEVEPDDLPITFCLYALQGYRKLNDEQTRRWVKARIIPPERQNIGMILRNMERTEYDEFEMLMHCQGKSCMDDFCLEECPLQALLDAMAEGEREME